MALFTSPCQKHKGIFLSFSLLEPGRAPGGKTHDSVGIPLGLDPSLEFLTLKPFHTKSLAICQLQFKFSYSYANYSGR